MKTICIDPGHGGKDPGAVGPSGLKEAQVVLAVALLMKAELLAAGDCKVVLTRGDDRFLELHERAAIANEAGANVFLSIHCNSATRPAMGIETFIARKTWVSFPLGEDIQDALCAEFPGHTDRGLKRAGFAVLRRTNMAAALAELEFIHVDCGERHLADKKVQRRYAQALVRGVRRFLELPALESGKEPEGEPDEPVACPALVMADRLDGVAAQLKDIAMLAREA